MDILLYKDGHLAVSESPLEGKENNLDDVVMLVTNPQDGDTLTYKSGKWVNGEGGGGSFAPDITNPQDGDTLVYNATAGKWVNGSGGGGGNLVVHVSVDEATGVKTLDKTWQEIHDALAAGTYTTVLRGDTSSDNLMPAMVGRVSFDEEYGYSVTVYDEYTTDYYAQTAESYPTTGGGGGAI